MLTVLRKSFYALVLLLSASAAMAQVATGAYPYGTFDNLGIDSINDGNLNVHFSLPVLNKAGRGLPFYYNLSYDSSVWYPATVSGTTSWDAVQNFGWRGDTEIVTRYMTYGSDTTTITGTGHSGTCTRTIYSSFIYHDTFGVSHPFPDGTTYSLGGSCGVSSPTDSGVAYDGSGYTLNLTAYTVSTVVSAGGKSFAVPNENNGSGTVTDSNGNQVSTDGSGHFTIPQGK